MERKWSENRSWTILHKWTIFCPDTLHFRVTSSLISCTLSQPLYREVHLLHLPADDRNKDAIQHIGNHICSPPFALKWKSKSIARKKSSTVADSRQVRFERMETVKSFILSTWNLHFPMENTLEKNPCHNPKNGWKLPLRLPRVVLADFHFEFIRFRWFDGS